MRRAEFCALALAAVLVQVVLVDRLPLPGGIGPDIALVLVVATGLTHRPATGLLTGFAAGLALDLAPPGGYLIGASALAFCLIGYGCGRLSGRLERSAPGLLAVAVIAVGAGEAAQAAAALIAPGSGVTLGAVRSALPAAALYDALLCAAALSVAALVGARPRGRLSAGGALRSAGPAARRGQAGQRGTGSGRASGRYSGGSPDPRLTSSAAPFPGTSLRADSFSGARFRSFRVRAGQPAGSLGRNCMKRRPLRRQARICRRVPRWTGDRPARRLATYGRAGGPR